MTWEITLKNVTNKEYINNAIRDLKEMFTEELRKENPDFNEILLQATVNNAVIAFVKEIIFEGKEIPIPSITEVKEN